VGWLGRQHVIKKKTEGLPSAVNASIMLAKLPQQVRALKNLMDYRISVTRYAPTKYGQADYITCSTIGALEFEVVYFRAFSISFA
jgi:hypothetical protein